ncbi:DNA topoisomerase (ATP-hydrolyzing) OS=Streptomyces tendae OX=1932 GN=GUR47_34900 PE=3 SV=1 [Streptomyces tendae]
MRVPRRCPDELGSLGNDDPPAAMRHTECRMAEAAGLMTIDEDTVVAPNYDGQEEEPAALPTPS